MRHRGRPARNDLLGFLLVLAETALLHLPGPALGRGGSRLHHLAPLGHERAVLAGRAGPRRAVGVCVDQLKVVARGALPHVVVHGPHLLFYLLRGFEVAFFGP